MKKYEIMFVLRPNMSEEETNNTIKHYLDTLEKYESKIISKDIWGLRELAYEIKKFNKGYYVLLNIEANSDSISEFDRLARINEDTLRYIIIDKTKDNKLEEKNKMKYKKYNDKKSDIDNISDNYNIKSKKINKDSN